MIAEVREERDIFHDRKFIRYDLEEAPEGHGGLPPPRSVESDVITVVGMDAVYQIDYEPYFVIKETQYRKEPMAFWSELEDGTIEIVEYQVWVPCEWSY